MAATKPALLSDPQCLSSFCPQPTDPLQDDDNYKMMVLRFSHDTTEEEVDRQFLRTALNLGINVPQDPKTTLDLVTNNVSALDLTSARSEYPPPPSRTSNSTNTASRNSSEQHGHTKTSSIASTSMTSAPSSVNTEASQKSSYTKIKRGIRRLSTLRRRRTMDAPIPPIPLPLAAIKTLRPPPPHRPVTVDHVQSNSVARKPVAKTPPELSPDLPVRVPSGSPDHGYDNPAAQERSMHDPHLKRLRWSQLDEQRRFNRFEADQRRVMRSRQAQRERRVLDQYPHKVEAAKSRHVDALASLEQRHLSAEVDLEKTLAIERRACETRIKHMEAYCNPRSTVRGMPSRTVTKQHHQQLEQQYRVWSGMDNLHAAKINVLREKQGKQVERVMGKQEAELKDMEQDLANDMQQLEVSRQSDEGLLRREFSARRKRLTSRWSLAEAIERKKLENETRETYAPLPPIEWKDPQQGTTEEEEESFDTELARDVRMAHDATSFNMI